MLDLERPESAPAPGDWIRPYIDQYSGMEKGRGQGGMLRGVYTAT